MRLREVSDGEEERAGARMEVTQVSLPLSLSVGFFSVYWNEDWGTSKGYGVTGVTGYGFAG